MEGEINFLGLGWGLLEHVNIRLTQPNQLKRVWIGTTCQNSTICFYNFYHTALQYGENKLHHGCMAV